MPTSRPTTRCWITASGPGVFLQLFGLLDDEGAVSTSVLSDRLDRGALRADCRLVRGHFHAKVIWWEGFGVYIGSANLTGAAWSENVECGVFFDATEVEVQGIDAQLDLLFGYLDRVAVPVTREMIAKLEQVGERRKLLRPDTDQIHRLFEQLFTSVPVHRGLGVHTAHGSRPDVAHDHFVREYAGTLQLLRSLAKDFGGLGLRPHRVPSDAHLVVHFDQFLHAFYYDRVRGSHDEDEDDDLSTTHKVEQWHAANRGDLGGALRSAAEWWAGRKEPPFGEDVFISRTAPRMRQLFERGSLAAMDLSEFREAMGSINAFRVHARQIRNAEFKLPPDHHENQDARINRAADLLWAQRTPGGRTVREVLDFVIWGDRPTDMVDRLWLGKSDLNWRLPHLGLSTLGEAVGWARPDDFPPRNNRTNKALRALGHDVRLYSKS